MKLLGLDIGGTKTSICIGHPDGHLLARQRIPTRPEDGPEAWRPRVRELTAAVLAEAGACPADITAVGIASPGPMSVKRGLMLEPPNLRGWINVPVKAWMEEELQRPTFINNDANACAAAEWRYGSCAGAESLLYLTMSTGLGGGIIVHGRVLQGCNDMGGEVGHIVLDAQGPPCPCGQRGCFELYCGGMNVAHRLRDRIVRDKLSTAILDHAGGDPARIDFKAFTAAVRAGDSFARAEFDAFLERLAQGIGTLLMTLNPEVVVLGTMAIHHGDLILAPLRERLPRYAWRYVVEPCRIVPSTLESRIGDLSALAVAMDGLEARFRKQSGRPVDRTAAGP